MTTTAGGHRLGKLAHKAPTFANRMAARHLMATLPAAPPTRDWAAAMKFPSGVMNNDRLGCCTASGFGHLVQAMTANNGGQVTISDADILKLYEGSTGYSPADPSTDQGGIEADVLAYIKAKGCGGFKIDGFAPAQAQNLPEIRQISNTFGGCYIGLALPRTIEEQGEEDGDTWDVDLTAGADAEPGSLGGHCVVIEAYTPDGFWIVTWGIRIFLTNNFMTAYNDEAWAILANGIWAPKGLTPAGDDVPAYDGYLQAVA